MKLVVTDTNVFIDVMNMDALEAFFALGLEMYTTDFVLAELANDQKALLEPYITKGCLAVSRLDERALERIVTMQTTVRIGFTDRTVVQLALDLKAVVLSGDGDLWKECKARRLKVHGSIWVMEQIWASNSLSPGACIAKLEALERSNERLPKAAIRELSDRIKAAS